MTEPTKRTVKPLSASSSISDLSFEDVRLEEAQRVSSNRTGTERSASVGLPPSAPAPPEPSPFGVAKRAEIQQPVDDQPADEEISWRGAPPPAGPAISVDPAALRENLASLAGHAATTAGHAANSLSDATLAASSKVLLSSARGREVLMEKLSKQIPPQAGSWLTDGLTSWSSGLTDTMHTGLNAVQQFWSNADASMKRAVESRDEEAQGTEHVNVLFELPEDEELVESFSCQLLQTYVCKDNKYTSSQQMLFAGHLFVTGRHVCFHCEPTPHFKIPLKSLKSVEKSTHSGTDVARLELADGEKLVFSSFKPLDLDNFLALAWHFTSDSQ